eukprot:GEMP01039825.1.p1 GENE.GEMP01039825.1~~GEMP01039825.1.p1  ORF type:complete len:363 (+),score=56.04 GEMP01039825.1:165-1253(+)
MILWSFFVFSIVRKLIFMTFFASQLEFFMFQIFPSNLYGGLWLVFAAEMLVATFQVAKDLRLPSKPDDVVTMESGSFVLKQEIEVSWVTSSLCGWRPQMEDAHLACQVHDGCVFGVFDGHGGKPVSKMAAKMLPKLLEKHAQLPPKDRLSTCIIELDEMLWRGPFPMKVPIVLHPFATIGSTCILCHVNDSCSNATIASTGDSRAILSRNKVAIALSQDHKPEDPLERKRIESVGGRVVRSGPCFRIDGSLNLSRALGDFKMKCDPGPSNRQRVICHPTVVEIQLQKTDDCLVLACDGLFEKFTRQAALDVIHEVRKRDSSVYAASWKDCASELAIRALARHPREPGMDNETVTIITWEKLV